MTKGVEQFKQLRLNLNHLLLLLHCLDPLCILKLRDFLREELSIASVDNVEEELAVNELVSVRIVVWKVLHDVWSFANLVINCAHTELRISRNTDSLDLIVRKVLLSSCKQLLQELELA